MTAPDPPPASKPQTDAARLTRLLRQHRRPICTSCAAARLMMDVPRVLDAVAVVGRTAALDQEVVACSVCGRSQWALSLRT